jgi:hypothetical protein
MCLLPAEHGTGGQTMMNSYTHERVRLQAKFA